jgi:hypothetical protein
MDAMDNGGQKPTEAPTALTRLFCHIEHKTIEFA